MSIQQAMNNMLMSAQIGAGLYAHSPAAKEKAEYKKASKEFQKTEKTYSQWAEPTSDSEIEVYEKMAEKQAGLASTMYSIKPTEKNYQKYKEALEGLIDKTEGKASQKRSFEQRDKILKEELKAKGGK